MLATVVVLRIEQDRAAAGSGVRRLRWSNAGHPPPLLRLPAPQRPPRPAAGVRDQDVDEPANQGVDQGGCALVRQLRTDPDLLLGLGLREQIRRDHLCDFPVNSTLLLYTDGLVERRDQNLDEGLDRLVQVMAPAPPAGPALGATPGPASEAAVREDPSSSAQRWVDAVLAAMLHGGHQHDVAVLAVHAHPEDRPRPPEAGPSDPRPGSSVLS